MSAAYTIDIFNSHCMDKSVQKFYNVLTTAVPVRQLLSAEGLAVLTAIVNIPFNSSYFPQSVANLE